MSEPGELVFSVTEKEFEQAVLERSRAVPVVVDFWAPWCGPCRSLAPVLERLVQQRGGEVLLAKVNTDEEQGLAMQYGVSALPTVVAFRDGRPALQFVGLLPENQLADFLDRVRPSEAEKWAMEAQRLEPTDPRRAEELYRQVLEDDVHHEAANLGLARLLIARDADAEAAELLERTGVGVHQPEEAERLAALLWLREQAQSLGDEKTLRERSEIDPKNAQLLFERGAALAGAGKYDEAMDLLLKAGEEDRKLATGKVRETMVKIFQVIGVRSETADAYRAKLSALLY